MSKIKYYGSTVVSAIEDDPGINPHKKEKRAEHHVLLSEIK
jgi:hypothetical protein